MHFPLSLATRYAFAGLLATMAMDAKSATGQWVKRPTERQFETIPGLVHETFASRLMKTTVGYSVVLPPSYSGSSKRYPVIYWLHGGGGNESSSLFTAKSWQDLYASNRVQEVILVYPNGFRSGYMDHHDGKTMIESLILQELIPHIDKRYRTIASRHGRAVHGFSMGASGSLKFAIKHPDLFCSAVAYGGGAIDLEKTKMPFVLNILERNLKSDPKLIRNNNTYHFLEKNHKRVRANGIQFLQICGAKDSWLKSAETFQADLQAKNIPCPLQVVPEVGHNLRGLIEAEGAAAAIFQDRVFLKMLREARKPEPYEKTDPDSAATEANTISESYLSVAEGGRRQGFQLLLPPGYSESEEYPLVVQLFGSTNLRPTRARPFLRIRPSGRGVWGYRSMSRYDVFQAISRTCEAYSVDEDRVYIIGVSSGATGVMHAAAQRPDVFAAVIPLVAFGNDLPLENFRNLPLRCEHGVNDWTSAIGNVRVQFQKLGKMAGDAKLNEHPTAGHGISMPPTATLDWMFSQRRNRSPQQVVYSCEHPRDGRAYWVTIRRFQDPHAVARVDAEIQDDRVVISTQNVQRLRLDRASLQSGSRIQLVVDGDVLTVDGSKDIDEPVALQRAERWSIATREVDAGSEQRQMYAAGAAANLFQGEPLLVSYGTGGDAATNTLLRRAAESLARTGGPHFKPAAVQFPVCSDTDLADQPLDDVNLLIIGGPDNHAWLHDVWKNLPISLEDGLMRAGDREPLKLEGSVLSLHYFNPRQPSRTLYVVSPFLNAKQDRERFLQNPRVFLAGSDGFKMIDQPDLMVRTADGRLSREMQFDDEWQFLPRDGAEERVPARYRDRVHLAIAHLKVMQREARTDYAIWWGPKDRGLFGGYDFNWLPKLDPSSYTLADYAVRRRETETMTAVLSTAELEDIHQRWIATEELVVWPEIKRSDLQDNSQAAFSVVIPMDLVPKLGIRRRTLSMAAPGPDIKPLDVAREVFR